jgi:hypothetical protein
VVLEYPIPAAAGPKSRILRVMRSRVTPQEELGEVRQTQAPIM